MRFVEGRARTLVALGSLFFFVAPTACEEIGASFPFFDEAKKETAKAAAAVASAVVSLPPPSESVVVADAGATLPHLPEMTPKEIAAYIHKYGLCRRRAQPMSEAETRRANATVDSSHADGGAEVKLPSPVIQHIVHESDDKLRACYEKGLARNPKLEGNVSIRFVITRNGTVTDVLDAGSNLPDTHALSCMTKVFEQLCFPPPLWGTVTVIHPIRYSPGS